MMKCAYVLLDTGRRYDMQRHVRALPQRAAESTEMW